MPQADTRQSPARAPWADAWSGQESSYRLLRSVHILSVLVSEILESKFLRRISPLPLNLSQLHLLKLMSFDGLRQVGDVAGSLGVSAPAATKNIDKLERLGLVIRTRSTGDRRTTLVSLSPEGRQLVREYERTKAFHLSSILGSFRPEELREFAALVERFCASLLGAEPPAAGPCMRCAAYLQEGCLVSEVSGGCPYRGVYSGHGTERAAGPPACSGDGVLWSE